MTEQERAFWMRVMEAAMARGALATDAAYEASRAIALMHDAEEATFASKRAREEALMASAPFKTGEVVVCDGMRAGTSAIVERCRFNRDTGWSLDIVYDGCGMRDVGITGFTRVQP